MAPTILIIAFVALFGTCVGGNFFDLFTKKPAIEKSSVYFLFNQMIVPGVLEKYLEVHVKSSTKCYAKNSKFLPLCRLGSNDKVEVVISIEELAEDSSDISYGVCFEIHPDSIDDFEESLLSNRYAMSYIEAATLDDKPMGTVNVFIPDTVECQNPVFTKAYLRDIIACFKNASLPEEAINYLMNMKYSNDDDLPL